MRNLEKEGLLERARDEKDKRRFILRITKKGRDLMDLVYPENEEIIVSMINRWNKEEQEQILKYMKKFSGIES